MKGAGVMKQIVAVTIKEAEERKPTNIVTTFYELFFM